MSHKRGPFDLERYLETGAQPAESAPIPEDACGSGESESARQNTPRRTPVPIPKASRMPVRRQGVAQAARERLAGSSYPALRALRLSFHEGVLTLRGRVPSYHMRQVAWKLVGELPGVEEFVDRLEVVEEPGETSDRTLDGTN
jgi:osmotically-inducible protein OsmY